MRQSLFWMLILRAVLAFADGDPKEFEANSLAHPLEANWFPHPLPTEPTSVNCSSTQKGAICDCDYASLGLSCRNVTNADSLPLALAHLFTLTHTHYWNHLSVNCVENPASLYSQIPSGWFSGKVKFASVHFAGNCSANYNDDTRDAEIRKMTITESTHPREYRDYGRSMVLSPIQGLNSLLELTINGSLFKDSTIKHGFSETCSECSRRRESNPHPLVKLTIRSCNVFRIESGAFRNLANLELIDLSYNQLSLLPRSAFPQNLTKLRILKLEHNRLTSLETGFFDGLPQLREVNLASNHLTMLPSFTTSWGILQEFHLGDNPWQCRCSMTWILRKPEFADILADKPACASPNYVRDMKLIEGLTVVNSTSC